MFAIIAKQMEIKKIIKKTCLILGLLIGVFLILFSLKTSFTISQIIEKPVESQESQKGEKFLKLPEKDPNRTNILLLGIRGLDDPGEGKLLSDAIAILSIKHNETGKNSVALISIPRDLYTYLWCKEGKHKVNFAYAYGGLDCSKKTVSALTGLYLDYAASVDFEGLKDVVDSLGGITIYRTTPFEENFQWAKEGKEENQFWFIKKFNEGTKDEEERWVFSVPKGTTVLDGATALYYVRSRYSTDDFDRMQRQHQVLVALKEKALSLGVLLNPLKIYNLLSALGKNAKIDADLSQIKEIIDLASNSDLKNIKTKIFDNTEAGLLYHTFINKEYVLLPEGDNFDKIQETCQNIFK